ncbi:protein-export chaperone SecB [Porphyromonas levii]|uniref:protein-export chaperone SecB n=1 Tax=Porphyromonas levii TaxID=28114 RepID=UPI001B8B2E71|nr:protein-export chaperone SecB [Porphyromonas levii]MBR8712293.1 hypothetical protein [Porphyromonas levii]MBR8714240.1 hypothetical protein [Porphyromonas levii]MBR8726782.1 hypothetical protein [Porphyromonas levii]MBR8735087.1 hypothetical protein [Porphyromonas levii]MBR8766038.1 hypothetical protein [Porphyromonas levii]
MYKAQNAKFRLKSYQIAKASLNFDIPNESTLKIFFNPSGKYRSEKGEYDLFLDTKVVIADKNEDNNEVVNVTCRAFFQFESTFSFKDIPDYFFPNCIAIVFPYIRAFISTLSVQANISSPIILPIVNLKKLGSILSQNTVEE